MAAAAIAAGKHALHGFFETLRTELRADGVDVMMVCPSFVATDFRFRTLDGDGRHHAPSPIYRGPNHFGRDSRCNRLCRRPAVGGAMLILSPAGKAAWWGYRV